ncbi:hypothetical protein F5148DRAFT_774254 [Russula earlei]|uniref:Uncharacterized protein n=1 Tax=Russula earlei TaxID=71964 RepID=A0ACC0UC82_9AGAM|nr:hypothetical protein F5148DRAFT_774254 [Russula earlei]
MFPEKTRKATSSRRGSSLATCDICGKRLARQSDMPRHKRLHDPKPDRWMHWCPEPGCDYGSMQRSNLRNHIRKHTGQRLHCPDDSTCNYSTSDKSALLRHRQRKHGYQTKSTAAKDRHMKMTGNRRDKQDNQSIVDTPSASVTDSGCPCFLPLDSNRQASGAMDELDTWQDDDHTPTPATITEQSVELIERPLDGYGTSRFPVSFARTRLPRVAINGAMTSSNHKHCRRCTCNPPLTPMLGGRSIRSDATSRSRNGVKVKELIMYRRVSYLVKESVFLATS